MNAHGSGGKNCLGLIFLLGEGILCDILNKYKV